MIETLLAIAGLALVGYCLMLLWPKLVAPRRPALAMRDRRSARRLPVQASPASFDPSAAAIHRRAPDSLIRLGTEARDALARDLAGRPRD